jgi:hypothetical protein
VRKRRTGPMSLAAVSMMAALTLAGCSDDYATSTSDTHVCVFDGSEKGGQKLKFQIPPGAESKEIDDNDQVVKIPASNRFYMAHQDRNVADPGAPSQYSGNAQGGVPVFTYGQARFRFNLEKACEWFSKHGRRNTPDGVELGFNVRGDANQGWFRFLNENFGVTMQEVVGERMGSYNWAFLHYNYPANADDAGLVPEGQSPGEPTLLKLGKELGMAFTDRLRANLGDDYFCGIDPSPDGEASNCPPIRFQAIYAGPGNDSQLVKDRQKVEDTRQALESARLEGQLRSNQQEQLTDAERAKAALLAEQVKTAEIQAQIDTAKCRQLAQHGLDCEGKRPPVVVGGQPVQ